jgi:hypothetical protein
MLAAIELCYWDSGEALRGSTRHAVKIYAYRQD